MLAEQLLKCNVVVIFLCIVCLTISPSFSADRWSRLSSLPNTEGFASSFAGVLGDKLVVAGGANFPDKKPWEGGKKKWYDEVWALDLKQQTWNRIGKLPKPVAYGVSVTFKESMICVGGSNENEYLSDVFSLSLHEGKLRVASLPSLPIEHANGAGGLVGNMLLIVGGQNSNSDQSALQDLWALDLESLSDGWKKLESHPGVGRILPIVATTEKEFYVVGGCELYQADDRKVNRRYLQDFYRYEFGKGWTELADFPSPIAAAASPAPITNEGLFVLGGDDGSQVGVPASEHKGFRKEIWQFDFAENRWQEHRDMPAPRVTLPTASKDGTWYLPSGEMRPGIRSPEVWSWDLRSVRKNP